jgi:hypothetical protein
VAESLYRKAIEKKSKLENGWYAKSKTTRVIKKTFILSSLFRGGSQYGSTSGISMNDTDTS